MREFSNGPRHANKAKMLRNNRSNLSIVFVEGDTDARFYGQFICHKSCSLVNTSGRSHALDAGDILANEKFKGFLVLVDRDDWAVEGTPPDYVVTTDCRDLETTLLRGGIALRLLAQHGDRDWVRRIEEKARKPLIDLLAEWAAIVGIIRWISNKEGRKLTTAGVDLTNFVNWDDLKVSVEEVVTFVLRQSGGSGGVPFDEARNELVTRCIQALNGTKDKWAFCQGHDLCHLLMRGLIRKFGNKQSEALTIEVFEASVRACCAPTEFALTEVYRKVRAWERLNAPFRVFPS
jgi:hypothetical protein